MTGSLFLRKSLSFFLGSGNETVVGGAGNDVVYGGLGSDAIYGGSGNDTIFAGQGGYNYIDGQKGNDLIFGAFNDTIYGGEGNDTIFAGVGSVIDGGSGDNLIIVNINSKDTLIGGQGNDTFRFTGGDAKTGLDTIQGFKSGEDVIELDKALVPGSGLNGTLTGADFAEVGKLGSGSTTAKIVYESSTGLVYYNSGIPGSTPVPLFELDKNLTINANSFKVI
jgi:Ca2+-binding RTX toxin-like protein